MNVVEGLRGKGVATWAEAMDDALEVPGSRCSVQGVGFTAQF